LTAHDENRRRSHYKQNPLLRSFARPRAVAVDFSQFLRRCRMQCCEGGSVLGLGDFEFEAHDDVMFFEPYRIVQS